MRIWGSGTARSLRPIWVAEELGLEYDLQPIGPRTGETKTCEYTALNRKQKIPFLEDGDIRLSESLAICRYLIAAYPTKELSAPVSSVDTAKEDEWCCYIYGEIDETSLYVMRRHRDLGEIYGQSEETVQSAAAYARRHLGVVADLLNDQDYLMLDRFGLPDILLMSCLDWASFYGVAIPDNLIRYRHNIARRSAYQKAMSINYKNLMGASNGTAIGS